MSEVVVVATLTAAPGRRDEAETVVRELLVPGTHAEPGCITFALHRDVREPDVLVIVERWSDQAALDAHLQAPHLAAFREGIGALLAGPPTVSVLSAVGAGDPAKATLAG